MELTKIETAQIKNQVYEKCKSMIIEGNWLPGNRLPSESQLCNQLGVSRVSVRSALQSLAAQGYIVVKRGEGSFVKEFNVTETLDVLQPIIALSNKDILQVLEFRCIIEPSIMHLVVERASLQDIQFLEENFKKLEKSTHDIEQHARIDEQFHMKLIDIVANPILSKVFRVLIEIFNSTWHEVCGILGTESGLNYHKKLIQVIQQRDAQKAQKIMKEHVTNTHNRIVAHYKSKT